MQCIFPRLILLNVTLWYSRCVYPKPGRRGILVTEEEIVWALLHSFFCSRKILPWSGVDIDNVFPSCLTTQFKMTVQSFSERRWCVLFISTANCFREQGRCWQHDIVNEQKGQEAIIMVNCTILWNILFLLSTGLNTQSQNMMHSLGK